MQDDDGGRRDVRIVCGIRVRVAAKYTNLQLCEHVKIARRINGKETRQAEERQVARPATVPSH